MAMLFTSLRYSVLPKVCVIVTEIWCLRAVLRGAMANIKTAAERDTLPALPLFPAVIYGSICVPPGELLASC